MVREAVKDSCMGIRMSYHPGKAQVKFDTIVKAIRKCPAKTLASGAHITS